MATTTLNTRIQLKYDTYENWTANNPVLLAGEVAVVVVPASSGAVPNEPTVLFKVGDGTAKFNALQWVAAPAADVYSWAKQSTKPTYQASEIEGLEDYISGQIEDTDTQYQIIASGTNGIQLQSRPKTGGAWTNVGSPITITYTLETGTTNGTVSFNGTEVAVKGLGSAAYTESSAYAPAGAGVPSTDGVPTDYLLSPAGWVAPPSGGGNLEIIDVVLSENVSSVELFSGKQYRGYELYSLIQCKNQGQVLCYTNGMYDIFSTGTVPNAYWGGGYYAFLPFEINNVVVSYGLLAGVVRCLANNKYVSLVERATITVSDADNEIVSGSRFRVFGYKQGGAA